MSDGYRSLTTESATALSRSRSTLPAVLRKSVSLEDNTKKNTGFGFAKLFGKLYKPKGIKNIPELDDSELVMKETGKETLVLTEDEGLEDAEENQDSIQEIRGKDDSAEFGIGMGGEGCSSSFMERSTTESMLEQNLDQTNRKDTKTEPKPEPDDDMDSKATIVAKIKHLKAECLEKQEYHLQEAQSYQEKIVQLNEMLRNLALFD